MISLKHSGDFTHTKRHLNQMLDVIHKTDLDKYGQEGVAALKEATPKDSGKTAESWKYKIDRGPFRSTITWYNTNREDGVPIELILQYGHATVNGGWVEGVDYINPAMRPIFKNMARDAWKEVTKK